MSLAKRIVARWVASQADEDEPHDPTDGVLHKWQYESLTDKDKAAWKGYTYRIYTWTWDATNYDEQDEPDSWGDNTKHGPVMTLDEVLQAIERAPFKKWQRWTDGTKETLESTVKKTKKTVTQGNAEIERVDGKHLSYEESRHVERRLKLK